MKYMASLNSCLKFLPSPGYTPFRFFYFEFGDFSILHKIIHFTFLRSEFPAKKFLFNSVCLLGLGRTPLKAIRSWKLGKNETAKGRNEGR